MKILDLTQGSAEWHAARATHFCASDAPAMMGASKYKSRNDLIREKATGLTETITPEKQALFDKGHAAERAIRPHVEGLIGEDLYPVTAEDGRLLASLDGMTMDEETLFEHKLWNKELVAQIDNDSLEPHYYWQLEHQLLVTGAKRVYFACSDGTPGNFASMTYKPVPGRAEKLLAGWKQFEADVANYTPAGAEPVTEKTAIMALPALSVQIVGKVTSSNLALYRESALKFIRDIKTDLQTDQDFADAEQTVKFCDKAEKELKLVKDQAISQTASIDELFRTIDQLSEEMRQKRLTLDKLVKKRKDEIRVEIMQGGRTAWTSHINTANALLKGRVTITVPMPDFAEAMKGKKTLTSLRSAVDDALAAAKIDANQQLADFQTNLNVIDELAKDHQFLVRDVRDLVTINPAHLPGIIKGRIAEHEEKEKARIEAERERIRKEEEAKAQREAERKLEEERKRVRDEEQRKARDEQADQERATRDLERALEQRRITLESAAQSGEKVAVDGKTGEVIELPRGVKPEQVVVVSRTPTRPTDDQIIEAISLHFRVHEMKVIEWLLDMDLAAASERAAAEFAN